MEKLKTKLVFLMVEEEQQQNKLFHLLKSFYRSTSRKQFEIQNKVLNFQS